MEKENELKARLKLLLDKKQIIIKKTNKSPESLLSLQEAFIQFQQELIKLQNFVEMNGTGFRKILKKFDRRTKATTKEIYLSSHVQVQVINKKKKEKIKKSRKKKERKEKKILQLFLHFSFLFIIIEPSYNLLLL